MKRIYHIELREPECMINLTEFSIGGHFNSSGELFEYFIRSEYYRIGSRIDFETDDITLGYLEPPINVYQVFEKDFRKLDKHGMQQYLNDYREREWGEYSESFGNLLKRFYELYPNLGQQQFYIINPAWFLDPALSYKSLENKDVRLNLDGGWWCYIFLSDYLDRF